MSGTPAAFFRAPESPSQPQKRKRIMKPILRCTCPMLVLTTVLAARLALAADPASSGAAGPTPEEMMKKVEAAGAPGPAHALLEPLVGDWNAEVKMWMGPGEPPTTSKATARCTWTLNKRFVQQEFNGEFMGKPFRGLSLTGYDNVRQKYNTVWVDDMSTTMAISEGDPDAAGKVITFTGTYACPVTGEKHKTSRQVYRILGRDQHVFEMHDPSLGEHSKTLEITYTRR